MSKFRAKTFASTFIYSKKDDKGRNTEQALIEFIIRSSKDRTRINKESAAFAPISNMVKERQKTAVLYRMLMNDNVVLAISPSGKELPASFKVFESVDIASGRKDKKIFIDCTGLINYENGYFSCKHIDTLCAYLFAASVIGSYYEESEKITRNNNIIKPAASCFVRMFTGVLDNTRVINFSENRDKISYITAMYFLFNLCQKDIKSAQGIAMNVTGINMKDANAYNIYFHEEEDFLNIDTYIKFLASTFNLKGLTTDVYINKWLTLFGSGTMYGLELLPSFLTILTTAYTGAYINRQNIIENMCGRDLVTVSENLLRIAAEIFNEGFHYDTDYTRNDVIIDNKNLYK